MSSWQSIQTLAVLLGPILLPKALALYRSLRSPSRSPILPISARTSYSLYLLFASSLLALLSTLPLFHPENIFLATQSRLGTLPSVLFTRLSALHPLTPQDTLLHHSFTTHGLSAKLIYLKFGPSALLSNPLLSSPIDPSSDRYHLLYSLPPLLAPHLLHLLLLGIATSPLLLGHTLSLSNWRTYSLLPALALPALEIYYLSTSASHNTNRHSTRVADMLPLYWRLPVFRGLGIAAVDAAVGYGIWLAASGRAFVGERPAGERVLAQLRRMEKVVVGLKGVGVVRNGSVRDARLRETVEGYWRREEEVMREVMGEVEVLEAERAAVRRMDAVRVGRELDAFVATVVPEATVGGRG